MADINWPQVAHYLGLPLYPNKGIFGQPEGAIIGEMDGQLVSVGPARVGRTKAVGIAVRTPPITDAQILRDALETNFVVRQVIGKGKERVNLRSMLSIGKENVVLLWPYALLKPPPVSQIVDLTRAVVEETARTVGRLDRRCIGCQQEGAPIVLLNDVPAYLCESCAAKVRAGSAQIAEAYARMRPRLIRGLLYGIGAGILSAVGWGMLAFLSQRIFLAVAILIGLFVGWAIHRGMGKFTWAGQVAAGLITLGSVLVGDILYVTLLLTREGIDFVSALAAVVGNLGVLFSEGDIWISLFFGLIGALYILYRYRPPRRVGISVEPLPPAV